jgi:DNA-binding IclR family transcriptional regulator
VINPELKPDERLITAACLPMGALVELLARAGTREWSAAELAARLELPQGKVRCLLHTGWAMGWIRPVQENPLGRTIDRWALDAGFAHYAELYRRALAESAAALDAQYRRMVDGPSSAALEGFPC